jgi:hypothetical protein
MSRPELDELLYLQGDEECDVSVQCRECDKGGEPVAFYTRFGRNPYPEDRVPTAGTIDELYRLMNRHVVDLHGAPQQRPIPVRLVARR